MRDEFKPAIDALLADLADLEKQVVDTKLVINRLCARAGMDPLFPDAAAETGASGPVSLRSDSFYGKAISTAAREYLEMRRASGLGPAAPREVYEALVRGGYTFEAKDETVAIIGLRATLRKNSSIFHRLPNGTYGLLSWYPNARPQRDEEGSNKPSSKGKLKLKLKRKPLKRTLRAPASETSKRERVRKELEKFLADGPKSRDAILAHMKEVGIMGSESNPLANLSSYLSYFRDFVESDGVGNWRLVSDDAEAQE